MLVCLIAATRFPSLPIPPSPHLHPPTHPTPSQQVRKALGGRSAAQLAHAVHEAQAAWSRWAVGLQWLIVAAEALGLQSIGRWLAACVEWESGWLGGVVWWATQPGTCF